MLLRSCSFKKHAHFAFIIHVQTLAQERMGMYGE